MDIRAVAVSRNHVGTLWQLPDGTTRWVPWYMTRLYRVRTTPIPGRPRRRSGGK